MKGSLGVIHEDGAGAILESTGGAPECGGPAVRVVRREGLSADGGEEGNAVPLGHPQGDGSIQMGVEQQPGQVSVVEVVVVGVRDDGAVGEGRRPLSDPADPSERPVEVVPEEGLNEPTDESHGRRRSSEKITRGGLSSWDGIGAFGGRFERGYPRGSAAERFR